VTDRSVSLPWPAFARAADALPEAGALRYSICTLVTRPEEYARMAASFAAGGFAPPDCEYLTLDNSAGNRFDAFAGCNRFLAAARGEYVILCHQDVELIEDGRARLDALLAGLDRDHPDWGLCGNAGGVRPGRLALRISDPHGENTSLGGPFPVRVTSLDENFIVVRRRANLGLSRDLAGFHLYGADLCLAAATLGWGAYVIDFHLRHHSPGKTDASFAEARQRLIDKYQTAFRPRWLATTCTTAFLSGSRLLNTVMNSSLGRRLMRRLWR
jgi:hypothetical protein